MTCPYNSNLGDSKYGLFEFKKTGTMYPSHIIAKDMPPNHRLGDGDAFGSSFGLSAGLGCGSDFGLSDGAGVFGLSVGGVSFLSFFFFSLGVADGVGVAIGSRSDCLVLAAPANMPERINVPAAAETITFLIMKPPWSI